MPVDSPALLLLPLPVPLLPLSLLLLHTADCNINPSNAASHDERLGAKLWEVSEQMVAAANLEDSSRTK